MEKIILKGIIQKIGEYDCIYVGNECVSDMAGYFDGDLVKMTYYISNTELTDENYEESFLTSFYNGISESDNTYCYGSSWTGCYGQNDEFKIGNRDVIQEIEPHIGRYCYMIITKGS